MKMYLGALLILGVALTANTATAGDSYDNCTGFIDSLPATLTTQGTWCLRKDLSTGIVAGAAVNIAANNVTVNCKGFKVGGLAAGTSTLAIGIASQAINSSVVQCNVRGFFQGVAFTSNGGGHLVEGNRFDANTRQALQVNGDGSMIRNNIIAMTGGSTDPVYGGIAEGIYVGIGNVDVIDNTIDGVVPSVGAVGGSRAVGIQYSGGSGVIRNNRIRSLVPQTGGVGTADIAGMDVSNHGSVLITGNHIVGTLGMIGHGVLCSAGLRPAVMRDNTSDAFQFAQLGCTDGGGNYQSD